jgi:DNA-binding LacI/PurR family transcriptional regulator
MLLQLPLNGKKRYNYIRLFDQQKVDGVIIVFALADNPGVKKLEERGVPAVLISMPSKKLDYVDIDNVGGTYKAVEHLIELGHKKIGIIAGRFEEADFKERFDAYKSCLAKHNLPCTEELIVRVHGDNTRAAGYERMKKLLVRMPTAVFASDDTLAVGAMKAIQEAGLRIPEDMAVVGFDDQPVASTLVPSLTTVRQSFFELGREAANLLLNRVEGKAKKQQKKIVPCELIVRDSSGGKIS